MVGLLMSSPLLAVVENIYVEHFEELAIGSLLVKPKMWIRYVKTFIVRNQGDKQLKDFQKYISKISQSIEFTMEKEENNSLLFLDHYF